MKAKQTLKLCISSCLLGHNVRYDCGNKLDRRLFDAFGPSVEWVPVCPEMECGMTVPREPMQLVGDSRMPRLVTVETKVDRTGELSSWAAKKVMQLELEGISGFIFKARSPSCGVKDTPLFSITGTIIGVRAGLFAEAVKKHFPLLPIEDEESLRDPATYERFLSGISA